MAAAWYYSFGDSRQLGPVSFSQLRRLAATGGLSPHHLVFQDGNTQWVRAGSVPDLFAVLDVVPVEDEPMDVLLADPPRGRPKRAGQPSPSAVAVRRLLGRVADGAGVLLFLAFLVSTGLFLVGLLQASAGGVSFRDVLLCGARFSSAPLFLPEGRLHIELNDVAVQEADAEKLWRVFPDPAEHAAAVAWGRSVFTDWEGRAVLDLIALEKQPTLEVARLEALRRAAGTVADDRLAAHSAWRRLTCGPGASEADLFRLREVVAAAVPDTHRRAELLAWAGTRIQRRRFELSCDSPRLLTLRLVTPPPDTDWFRHWVLYDDLAVTDEVFAARRLDALALFSGESKMGRDTWATALRLGRQMARERAEFAGLGEPDDRVAFLALRDDLAAAGPHFDRVWAELLEGRLTEPTPVTWGDLLWAQLVFLRWGLTPCDDAAKFTMGDGWFVFGGNQALATPEGAPFVMPTAQFPDFWGQWLFFNGPKLMALAVVGWLAFRGMRLMTVVLPGWLLGLTADPRFRSFRHDVERPRWGLATLAVIVVLSFLAELVFIDPFWVLFYPGMSTAFACIAVSVVFGGLLVEAVANLITVAFMRFGLDPEKTWLDEVVAAVLAVPMLLAFGNEWHLVVCSALIGLAPGALHKLLPPRGSETKYFPIAGAPRRAYEHWPILTLVVGTVLPVVMWFLAFNVISFFFFKRWEFDSGSAYERQTAAQQALFETTATQLADAARFEPPQALAGWGETKMLVRGVGRAGGLGPGADWVVTLDTGRDVTVRCHFKEGQAVYAFQQRGRELAVVGRLTGLSEEGRFRVLTLEDCVLAEGAGPLPGLGR